MSKRAEMIGKRFGRLVVTRLSENTSGKRKRLMYYCDCDCGKKDVEVVGEKLRNGHTKSCGCYAKDRASETHKKYNEYDLTGEYGIGWTTNTNQEFYFDLEDYDLIKSYTWLEMKNGYIFAHPNKDDYIYLHRLIMNPSDDEIVDHKKHRLFDNRKDFLRIGNQSQNMMNASKRIDNTSGTTGISQLSRDGKWSAEIQFNNKKIRLGIFEDLEDAIKARKEAEEKYFGEWSLENSMNEKENITI